MKAWKGRQRPSAVVREESAGACRVRQQVPEPLPVLRAAWMQPEEEAKIGESSHLQALSFLRPGARRPALLPAEALPEERAVPAVLPGERPVVVRKLEVASGGLRPEPSSVPFLSAVSTEAYLAD